MSTHLNQFASPPLPQTAAAVLALPKWESASKCGKKASGNCKRQARSAAFATLLSIDLNLIHQIRTMLIHTHDNKAKSLSSV